MLIACFCENNYVTSPTCELYDCCTYFQSITKIVQAFFTLTFETFYRTFFVPQNRVYTQKQFYFKNI